MSMLCIITARGGSKRIPRKNIRMFCGKPIIAYSIGAARESGLFDEVMVSTDDDEIAETARAYGAAVPFRRSAQTSDDFATTADVLCEVLERYSQVGRLFDTVCCLYPTAPFVTAEKLKRAFALYSEDHDSVLSAVAFSFPPQRALVLENGLVTWWLPEYKNARSQDLEPVYHDAGQFYFSESALIMQERTLIGHTAGLYIVPETEAQDIDNESDWAIAEMKYERMAGLHGKTS